jgi:hypothetical protein
MLRHMCSELVSVICDTKGPQARVVSGNLEEIGEWTAQVLLDEPLAIGTMVAILTETHELKGVVQGYEGNEPLGYFVEVKLAPESRWCEQHFVPKYMLRIRQSIAA